MKLAILARDGVIYRIRTGVPISAEGLEPLPGSLEAIARLNHADYRVALISNEPGLASGTLDLDNLNDLHNSLQRQLTRVGGHIDGIFFCPHAPDAQCECRLPKPGLLHQVMERFDVLANDCRLIAHDPVEIDAARRCRIPVLHVDDAVDETQSHHQAHMYSSLTEAVETILHEDSA